MIEFFNSLAETWTVPLALLIAQNTLYLLIVLLLLFLLKNTDARIKYLIALTGIFKLLLPGFIPISFSFLNSAPATALPISTNAITIVSSEISYEPVFNTHAVILLIWMTGAGIILFYYLISSIRLFFVLKKSDIVHGENINDIKIYKNSNLVSPLITLLRPNSVFVPDEWDEWTHGMKKHFLFHEMAHLARKDTIIQPLQLLVKALYFFHPLVWVLDSQLKRYRERACDLYVLRLSKTTAAEYSRNLVQLAENFVQRQMSLLTASSLAHKKKELLHRITYLLKEDPMPKISKYTTGLMLIFLIISGLALSMTISIGKENNTQSSQKENITQPPPPIIYAKENNTQPPPPPKNTIEKTKNVGKITGTVIDKSSNNPLAGANVLLHGTKFGVGTNDQGKFFIPNVPPGVYSLEAQFVGYKSVLLKDFKVNINKTTELELALEPVVITIPTSKERHFRGGKTSEVNYLVTDTIKKSHVRGGRTNEVRSDTLKDESTNEEIYEFHAISEKPRPVGGVEALRIDIKSLEGSIAGTVTIHALIDEKGEVQKAKVIKSLNPVCDKAAVEAVKTVVWKAAKQRDKNVAVWVSIPVEFK